MVNHYHILYAIIGGRVENTNLRIRLVCRGRWSIHPKSRLMSKQHIHPQYEQRLSTPSKYFMTPPIPHPVSHRYDPTEMVPQFRAAAFSDLDAQKHRWQAQ